MFLTTITTDQSFMMLKMSNKQYLDFTILDLKINFVL